MKRDQGQGVGFETVGRKRGHAGACPVVSSDDVAKEGADWAQAQRIAHVGTWSWEALGSDLICSPEVHRILGLAPETGEAAPDVWGCLCPSDRQALTRWLARLRRGHLTTSIVVRIRWPGGVIRHVQLQGRAASRAETNTRWIHGTIFDVTEHRERDLQLQKLEKMSALGTLAGGIAHDYNNFLQVIIGNIELLRPYVSCEGEAPEILEEITLATRACAELTQRLSSFGQRGSLPAAVVDLPQCLLELRARIRGYLGGAIELRVVHECGRRAVRIDLRALDQLLCNLCHNARDAMPEGGRVTIETGEVEVDAEYSCAHPGLSRGPHLRLGFSDTGLGIDAETLPRIFEPFFTTKPRKRGGGLGLSIAYGIVAQAGGHIEVESTPGGGTQFRIYLPLCAADGPEGALGCGARPTAEGLGKTILLVDDEAQVRTLARRVLEREGYRVLEAVDGREAMGIVARGVELDLLLSDVVMPEMDGIELLRRALHARPKLSCVLMSGYTGEQGLSARRLHQELGAKVALRKPFTLTELLHAVGQALDHKVKQPAPN